MMERRRYPRYSMRLRAYFPDHDLWGHTIDISLEGCFIKVERLITEGFVADLLLELPVVGPVLLKGYVHHTGSKTDGLGMQFVRIRFSREKEYKYSTYYAIYMDFVRTISKLEGLREQYQSLVEGGRLERLSLPETEE